MFVKAQLWSRLILSHWTESLMQMVAEEVSVSECTGDEQTYRMSEVEES